MSLYRLVLAFLVVLSIGVISLTILGDSPVSSMPTENEASYCGDWNIDEGEDCDEGAMDTEVCNSDCTNVSCGDGYINAEASEECDPPDDMTCDENCLVIVECGNGIVEDLEECDDGNSDEFDSCSSACTLTGFLDPAFPEPEDCNGVAGGDAMVDDCGVCGGDGTSCAGCDGMPNSGLTNDACGVCGGDGTSCADCNGTPNGSATYDSCGVCGGNDADMDACGMCFGDGSSCADCNGTPNGTAFEDECGVCGGDGSTCATAGGCNCYGSNGAVMHNCSYPPADGYATCEAKCCDELAGIHGIACD